MYTRVFNDMRELNNYVNEKKIKKEDIVNIFQDNEGSYLLVYYER